MSTKKIFQAIKATEKRISEIKGTDLSSLNIDYFNVYKRVIEKVELMKLTIPFYHWLKDTYKNEYQIHKKFIKLYFIDNEPINKNNKYKVFYSGENYLKKIYYIMDTYDNTSTPMKKSYNEIISSNLDKVNNRQNEIKKLEEKLKTLDKNKDKALKKRIEVIICKYSGNTYEYIQTKYGVSKSAAQRWVKEYEKSGNLSKKSVNKSFNKYIPKRKK